MKDIMILSVSDLMILFVAYNELLANTALLANTTKEEQESESWLSRLERDLYLEDLYLEDLREDLEPGEIEEPEFYSDPSFDDMICNDRNLVRVYEIDEASDSCFNDDKYDRYRYFDYNNTSYMTDRYLDEQYDQEQYDQEQYDQEQYVKCSLLQERQDDEQAAWLEADALQEVIAKEWDEVTERLERRSYRRKLYVEV